MGKAATIEKALVLAAVCDALREGATDRAAEVLRRDYPFAPEFIVGRSHDIQKLMRVFVRDGFIDRYSGERLVFLPVLRVISEALPADFPYHPNWKAEKTHSSYWQMGATLDHLVPVSRGGADDESNWVTTSMAHNSAKLNWTLDELGWTLHPPGDCRCWDGLVAWFLEYTNAHPGALSNQSLRQWHKAATTALA